MDRQQLDEAWSKMRERVQREPENAHWKAFSERLRLASSSASAEQRQLVAAEARPASAEAPFRMSASAESRHASPRNWGEWLHQRRRWIAGAVAACAIALTVATPAGNHALAALLDRFRMEQLTAVEKQDMAKLFSTVGISESTINRYGEFSHTTDGEFETYPTLEELQQHASPGLLIPGVFRDEAYRNQLRIGISPPHTIALKVKVEAINAVMRRLGAVKLLPASIDGKQIRMTMGSEVSIKLYDSQTGTAYAYAQQPVPTVSVDAGVPTAEALEAVAAFPLIPAELKQALTQTRTLDDGSAPLPVVVPSGYDRLRIGHTDVLLAGPRPDDGRYAAVWVKDGQLFTFSGSFADRAAFTTTLTEMIET